MAECYYCEKESEKLYTCKDCGRKFCEECGDVESGLCNSCKNVDLKLEKQEMEDLVDNAQDMAQEEMDEEGD